MFGRVVVNQRMAGGPTPNACDERHPGLSLSVECDYPSGIIVAFWPQRLPNLMSLSMNRRAWDGASLNVGQGPSAIWTNMASMPTSGPHGNMMCFEAIICAVTVTWDQTNSW